jgi:hypothetical protein
MTSVIINLHVKQLRLALTKLERELRIELLYKVIYNDSYKYSNLLMLYNLRIV